MWTGVLLSVFLSACVEIETVDCDDGSICPLTLTCAPEGGCASTIQIDNCEGLLDGETCETGAGLGKCTRGVCRGSQCGNGVVDEGENCDVGITTTANKCRNDCQKFLTCGDGIIDSGEACDDGNENNSDSCTVECRINGWIGQISYSGIGSALEEPLDRVSGVFVDRQGNMFIADKANNRVLRVDATTKSAEVVAGTGTPGFSGDNGPATSAELNMPRGISVDGVGNLFIADRSNERIRRVDANTGIISTVAGGGNLSGAAADNHLATDALLNGAYSVFVTGNGDMHIVEGQANRIRFVDGETGIMTTVAGGGNIEGTSADEGLATNARLNSPGDIHVVGAGSNSEFFIADRLNQLIRRVDSAGIITTVAGGGSLNPDDAAGGSATEARLFKPSGVHVVSGGASPEFFMVETDRGLVRRVDSAGVITTVAGASNPFGTLGDDGPATSASLNNPVDVCSTGAGDSFKLYIADSLNNRVRQVDSNGVITTVVGAGVEGFSGDGGLAISASLNGAKGVFAVGTGSNAELYIADTENDRIRYVDSSGVITTVAGDGDIEDLGDNGLATEASVNNPAGIFVAGTGLDRELFIADTFRRRIRRVGSDGVITTVAGNGFDGFAGDEGLAISARLSSPSGIFVVGEGASAELYIADSNNNRIRRVDSAGIITTVAGSGPTGFQSNNFGGDNGAATSALLSRPSGIHVVGEGASAELYIADTRNNRIRRVDSAGMITTVAGSGLSGFPNNNFGGDNGAATSALLSGPSGIQVVGEGASAELYIADTRNNRIRRVDSDGIITTVAGSNRTDFSGDGGLATTAGLGIPLGISVVGSGNNTELYIADGSNRIRRVDSEGFISTVAGKTFSISTGLLATREVGLDSNPQSAVRRNNRWLVAGGSSGSVQEIDLATGILDVLIGRYSQGEATEDLARFRDEDFGTIAGVASNEADGKIYLTEPDRNRVHVVTTDDTANGIEPDDANTWTIAVLGGNGTNEGLPGYSDGALATSLFRRPAGLFFSESTRILYVADTGNHVIRAIDVDGATVSTFAGTPETRGYLGDDGLASDALLFEPVAITECFNGDIFIAEVGSHHIRRVDASTGIISTVLGVGVAGSSGAGSPSTVFPVDSPRGVTCDHFGNVYVTSRTAVRLLAALDPKQDSMTGIVDGTGSVQTIYESPLHQCLTAVAVEDPSDSESSVFATDSCAGAGIELERVVQ